jgi:hypothetical protein
MATEILIKGVPSSLKPQPSVDNQREGVPVRTSRYGGQFIDGVIPTKHALADEGSYFTANNGQTGQITSATSPTSFTATIPSMIIFNNASLSPTAPKIYLDYAIWAVQVAGATLTSVQCAIVRDTTNRFSALGAGGVQLTPVQGNSAGPASVAKIWAGGQLTATAASSNAVFMVGDRILSGVIPVVNDVFTISFGSVDNVVAGRGSATIASHILEPVPPMVLNAGECGLIYLWYPGMTTTGITLLPEFGWWER